MMLRMCTISRLRILKLYINVPYWRLTIFAHFVAAILSVIAIISFGRVVRWRIGLTPDGGNILGWSWGNVWLESLAFVPPILSLAWAFFTMPYLLMQTCLVHPGFDLGVQSSIFALNSLPIAFAFSAYGPMQWMADGADPDSGGTYAGRWEIVGLLALILLEFESFLLGVWAWRRLYWLPKPSQDQLTRSQSDEESLTLDVGRDSVWLPSSRVTSMFSDSNSTVGVGSIRSLYVEKGVDTERTSRACPVPTIPSMAQVREERKNVGIHADKIRYMKTKMNLSEERDPELPRPLQVRGAAQKTLYKNGNGWQLVDASKERGPGW